MLRMRRFVPRIATILAFTFRNRRLVQFYSGRLRCSGVQFGVPRRVRGLGLRLAARVRVNG